MAEELFASDDEELWRQIFDQYSFVLKKKSDNQKKTGLADLDRWYQDDLPKEITSRSPMYLSKEELIRVMKWKLMRGKFRPRLTELVQQNSEKDVKNVSEKAFKNYKNIKEAIKELSKLKAVGPATASAIMTASNPGVHAFMADEVMESIPGFKLAYTLQAYVHFQEALANRAQKLKQDSDFDWTPHKVELALWTNKLAKKLGVTLTTKMSSNTSNSKNKKRGKDDDDETDDTDDEAGKTKLKRRKAK